MRTTENHATGSIVSHDVQDEENIVHRETLDAFDRNVHSIKTAYSISYYERTMLVADKMKVNIDSILQLGRQAITGFKSTVNAIALNGSRSPRTLVNQVRKLEKGIRDASISSFSPENCKTLVEHANDDYKNAFHSFLNLWFRLGYPGVDSEAIDVINSLKPPSRKNRRRIISDDQTEGWYTDQEFDDLVDAYWNNYEAGSVNLRNTVTLLLNAQYGRRGVQYASLKIIDFQSEGETDGISGRRIVFPGAKDRGAEEWFRGSKDDVHPVGDDLWNLCQLQIQDCINEFERRFGRSLSEEERGLLPFIQPGKFTKKQINRIKDHNFSTAKWLPSDYFHCGTSSIAQILTRSRGNVVISHRTGERIREFAYRMRYTRARQLARMDVPRLTLQYWLGHEDDKSIDHYYSDPAEDARLLNEEVRLILAPLAQAFAGTIRDKESDARRGRDPASRIELDGHINVGSCGLHGYCSASVPIPCYRCAKFEPWVDGPHDEVLIRLIEREEEENNIHLPSKSRRMLTPLQLKKDIAAVKLVIRLCDERKRELANNVENSINPDNELNKNRENNQNLKPSD